MNWLFRAALRLVPLSWREAVRSDLEEESSVERHGSSRSGLWRTWQVIRLAPRFVISSSGGAFWSDLKYALRSLHHARWFTVGAVLTFALGIGVNTAVFAAVDRMLFRPLPYAAAERLYFMQETNPATGQAFATVPASWVVEGRRVAGIEDLGFTDLFTTDARVSEDPSSELLVLSPATFNILAVAGVRPIIGRSFVEEDARQRQVFILLSYEAWKRRFGGRADILAVSLWQGRNRLQIVGVLPQGFVPPAPRTPTHWEGFALMDTLMVSAEHDDRLPPPVVRIRVGEEPQRVEAELRSIATAVARSALPVAGAQSRPYLKLTPVRDQLFRYYRPYLWLVVVAAGLVLAMACANLASLLLVRERSREHRTAMSLALGASRRRIVGTALTEALLLSAAGSAVGFVVLTWTGEWLRAVMPPVFVTFSSPLYDSRVLALSLSLTSLTAVMAAAGPALRSSRVDILPVLQRTSARAGRLKGGASLLFIEASLGVILVACAVLAGRSLFGLFRTDLGFEPHSLRRVTIMFPFDPTQDEAVRFRRYLDALGVLQAMPGVSVAGAAEVDPLARTAGEPFAQGYDGPGRRWMVTDGFFDALGMKLVAGRTISRHDVERRSPVAVLSMLGLRLVLPDVEPARAIGRTVELPNEPARHIIGVVNDIRVTYASNPVPSIYVPASPDRFRFLMYEARTTPGAAIDREVLSHRIREQVADPASVTVGDGDHQASYLWATTRDDRFRAVLFGTFGSLGLLLACVGLYAVASCEVGMRRSEWAIRASLGATMSRIKWEIVRSALRPVVAGATVGLLLAFWGLQFFQAFVHRIDARDPSTLLAVVCVLISTSVLAAWIPARRAARTDPAVVLRSL